MREGLAFALAVTAGVAACSGGAPRDAAAQLVRIWFEEPPTLAPIDSGQVLAYELHLTSGLLNVPAIRRIDVQSGDDPQTVLLELSGSALGSVLRGVSDTTDFLEVIEGPRVVAYMWVPLDGATVPEEIRHRLTIIDEDGMEHDVDVEATPVQTRYSTIAPPVQGSHWLAGNGPSNESGHRRFLFANSGRVVLWERFAIDFQLVDSAGRNFRTDGRVNSDHYCYDQPVFAVADGRVVEIRSDLPENTPNEDPVIEPDFDTVSGNHVTLDIGGGRYVLYAHLRRGSVTVNAGDSVKQGRLLGRIGNSGLSRAPHLHFQMSDHPGIYAGEGMPYAFERYEVIGECDDSTCTRLPSVQKRIALPRDGQLLRFVW